MNNPVPSGPVVFLNTDRNTVVRGRMCAYCGEVFVIKNEHETVHLKCRKEYMKEYVKYYREGRKHEQKLREKKEGEKKNER